MNLEEFNREFELGKIAIEKGAYRQSIKHLETAKSFISPNTKQGGEVQIWLVAAYQANGMIEQAIAQAQELCSHPSLKIRQQATNLIYILKAPRLERPKEWLTEIPDLSQMPESPTQIVAKKKPSPKKVKRQIEIIDLSQVNTEDNQFVWVGLIAVVLISISLFLFFTPIN